MKKLVVNCESGVVEEVDMSEEEIAQLPNAEEQILAEKIAEAKQFLNDTQFKFGDDYDQKDTPEWLELKAKRQELREFIRSNNG